MATRSCSKNSAATIPVRADRCADSRTAACGPAGFDGSDRHHFFPRVVHLAGCGLAAGEPALSATFPRRLPRRCARRRSSAPSSLLSGLALRFATLSACGSAAAAQIIAGKEAPRRACPSAQRASKEAVTLRADLRPAGEVSVRCSASRAYWGGFAMANLEGAASLALAPAQSARCLERWRERQFLAARRLRAPVLRSAEPV